MTSDSKRPSAASYPASYPDPQPWNPEVEFDPTAVSVPIEQPIGQQFEQQSDWAAAAEPEASRMAPGTPIVAKVAKAESENVASREVGLPLYTRTKPIPPIDLLILLAIVVMVVGLSIGNFWLAFAGTAVTLLLSIRILWAGLWQVLTQFMTPQERLLLVSLIGITTAGLSLVQLSGLGIVFSQWYQQLNWDAIGASGEVFGALGQILIAVLAVYIAWRQYIISKDLTIQQNMITQQQTIDSYFQGISELVLDEEGLLEDWPQERAIAEGRTAAILSSVDAGGKAKVLRFLSRSRLLSPLKRDRRLGRAILDGRGGYAEDRNYGVRVIDLGVMLANADLSGTDLRWTDLSDINLIRANLRNCDLVKANFTRTILCGAVLAGSDLMGAKLFYGSVTTASPRTKTDIPDYTTGAYTGAVVAGADFTGVKRKSLK
ncbi:MAG: pentapeptide repeat-containing protein [Elainella sp. Prado103]|nr:pentapeptide repeat-containing protein [Elainella sp. Prado103]